MGLPLSPQPQQTDLVPRPLEKGEKLTIKKPIGRGGFAACYKASWTAPGAKGSIDIALKVLLPLLCEPKNLYWKHFQDEASVLAVLDHPNIVKCMGLVLLPSTYPGLSDKYEGRQALAMILDYCEGGSVKQLVAKQLANYNPIYTFNDACCIMIDIGNALAAMHSSKPPMMHRDVKLDNMLLTKEPNGKDPVHAKMADFGLHVVLDPSKSIPVTAASTPMVSRPATASGNRGQSPAMSGVAVNLAAAAHKASVHANKQGADQGNGRRVSDINLKVHDVHNLTGDTGSPIYMAPEVFKKQMYNEKADVFSFGVMMYETFGRTLLVFTHIGDGRNCFQTTDQFVAAVAQGWRPSKPETIPEPLWELVQACWHPHAIERPAMREVVRRLSVLHVQLLDEMTKLESKCVIS